MWKSIQTWFVERFVIDFLIGWVEDGLGKASDLFGINGKKLAISVALMVLGTVIVIFPEGPAAVVAGALMEFLSEQPHDVLIDATGKATVAAGSFGWAIALIHRGLKKLREKLGK